MRVTANLIFLEAKVKQKYDGSGSYKVVVFYDANSESVLKPFVEDGIFGQVELLKMGQKVDVQMDVYDGKNGMACKLDKVITSQK